MRSVIHVSALLLAFGACIGLVTAKHMGTQRDSVEPVADTHGLLGEDFSGPTGSIGVSGLPRLSLTDEQRGYIFFGVVNLPDVPDVTMRTPFPAERLPETVELHDIPAMVIRQIPHVRDFKFVKLDDRILLVDAETRRVEAMIPRYKLVVR
jgi:hypothetical protein